MKSLFIACLYVLSLGALVSSCTDVFVMSAHEVELGGKCEAPAIMQNCIGTWRCGQRKTVQGDTLPKSATINKDIFSRLGTLTFDANAYMDDPDSLFENRLDYWGTVLYKKISVETNNDRYPGYGELFWIRQYAKDNQGSVRGRQGYYFKVITNQCDRIHLIGDSFEMVLIRQ